MREIDALDGVMGIVSDKSGIQFRLLNRSRGPAVRGPRTQSDRALYKKAISSLIKGQDNLEIIIGEVVDFLDVGWDSLRWPIFNLADSYVTIGVFVLIFIHSVKEKSNSGNG